MQYVVIGWDGTDDGAPDRRRKARPTHLERIQPRVETGEVLVGAISKLLLFSPDAGIGAAPTREIGGGETQLQEVMMLSFCH